MEVLIRETSEQASLLGAQIVAQLLRRKPHCVLGLATGRTPVRLYGELIRFHREEGLDLGGVVTFNLDEYVGLPADHPQSYHYYMGEHLFRHINIRPEATHVPDGCAPDLRATASNTKKPSRTWEESIYNYWVSVPTGISVLTSQADRFGHGHGSRFSQKRRFVITPLTPSITNGLSSTSSIGNSTLNKII